MDSELKAKWVKALRSGEYEQGRDIWVYGNAYCCVGLLCEIGGKRHGLRCEPRVTAISLGLSDNDGNDQMQTLIRMNDIYKMSFTAIADYIEANL